MNHFSLWHWLIALVFWWLAIGWPCMRILKKMGYGGWWTIVSLIPVANVVGIWVLAIIDWPSKQKGGASR